MLLTLDHLPVSPDQAVAQLDHVGGVRGGFPSQDASMDSRVQGLHPAAQHLRVSGQLGHIPDTRTEREMERENRRWQGNSMYFNILETTPGYRRARQRFGVQELLWASDVTVVVQVLVLVVTLT